MKMGLYNLFSCNVEIQYKSYFLSKAMLFTVITTLLTVVLPFILAYRSRDVPAVKTSFAQRIGHFARATVYNTVVKHCDIKDRFWLKSHSFYEQPTVHFTYEFLLIAETEEPSQPIICGEASILDDEVVSGGENCAEVQIQEHDYNEDGKNDVMDFKFLLNIPPQRTVASVIIFLALDFQLKAVCPLHMQSLAVITREFAVPPSGLKYFGDLQLYQVAHLSCLRHHIDTKHNVSLFNYIKDSNENIVDFILQHYYNREVTTETKAMYSRSQNGHTGAMNIDIRLRIPEMQILYRPSLLQELKWAWPQYLSLVFIFHWVFNKIKKFVFSNRLLMAWEVIPWKNH